jgi:CheY-like chemotaxis protein
VDDPNDPNVHIVYIDDDENSCEIVRTIMKSQMGMTNLTVYNDSSDMDAKLMALPGVPALILLDLQMEPLTGFDVLKSLRENAIFTDVKIVALTASITSHDVQAIKKAGFNGYIGKPIGVRLFPVQLRKLLDGQSGGWIG